MGKIGAKAGWQSPSLQRLPERSFRMVGRPDYSPCSRNARPQKNGMGSLVVLLLAERAR